MGILSGTADSKAQYVKVWKGHINDLSILALAADISHEELAEGQCQLRNWLAMAVGKQKIADV